MLPTILNSLAYINSLLLLIPIIILFNLFLKSFISLDKHIIAIISLAAVILNDSFLPLFKVIFCSMLRLLPLASKVPKVSLETALIVGEDADSEIEGLIEEESSGLARVLHFENRREQGAPAFLSQENMPVSL